MGVRFVLGRVGTGKSRRFIQDMGERLATSPVGPPLILLVPEQMTQEADRLLAITYGGTVRAQSLSFRRLAFRLMQEVGGATRIHIDDTGKKMLLYKFARKHAASLKSLRRVTESGGWIDGVQDWFAECKRYQVDARTLRTISEQSELSPVLRDKLADLSLLFEETTQALSVTHVDSEDYVTLLGKHIPHSAWIRDAEIWVDGFHGFTPSEEAVLGQLFQWTKQVHVSLTLPQAISDTQPLDELELFHPTARTFDRLQRLANAGGITAAVDIISEAAHHRLSRSPVLSALEQMFVQRESDLVGGSDANLNPNPNPNQSTHNDNDDQLTLVAASHTRAETEAVAREIIRLLSDGKARWRDIAVFVRDWENYGDLIEAVFADYGIPCFLDQKRSTTHHPLSEFVRSALEVITSRWTYDALFRLIKTDLLFPEGIFPTTAEQRFAMDKLENYALEYGIQGSRWTDGQRWRWAASRSLEEEEHHPTPSQRHRSEEDALNEWRMMVVTPMQRFEQRLRLSTTIREQAEALVQLLEETGAAHTLERWATDAQESGHVEKAREHQQLWVRIMDVLDQLVELVGREPADTELFTGMLTVGLDGIRMGLVPPALDQVLVGSLDRTRSFGVKRLFLLGVNDGIIPMAPKEQGIINEVERLRLQQMGLELAPDNRRRLLDERYMLYNALFLPSDGLWLSFAMADLEGKPKLPSEWFNTIKQMVPGTPITYITSDMPSGASEALMIERLVRPSHTLSALLPQLRRWQRGESISGVWWAAYNWLCSRPYWQGRLQAMLPSLFYRNAAQSLSEETSLALFGQPIRSSVSRLERFAACPFAHYATYGLKLKERKRYQLKSPDIGQLYHAALSLLAKALAADGKTWADLEGMQGLQLVVDTVDQLTPRLGSAILFSSHRHRYITSKLKQVIRQSADVLSRQARRSQFHQVAAELAFSSQGELPAWIIPLHDGTSMELTGRIDRIDLAKGENNAYIQVIDYKSGNLSLSVGKVYYGLSLQLLAYAHVASAHATAWLGHEATPSGAFYFHVHRPMLSAHNAEQESAWREIIFKNYQLKGMWLGNDEVARLMDTALESGSSPVFPLAWKKDGSLRKKAAITDGAQWESLFQFVQHKVAELGTAIRAGTIEASPYRDKTEKACTFCPHKPVCGFDPDIEGYDYRNLPSLKNEEIWERIRNEGER